MATLCRSRSTHWKQTVVYLEDTITICQGEVITGQLPSQAMAPMFAALVAACGLHL